MKNDSLNLLLALVVVVTFSLSFVTCFREFPIDKYVNTPDKSFTYEVVQTQVINDVTVTWINMTSQTWLNSNLVSSPVWYHNLVIAVPSKIQSKSKAMLFIEGGDMGKKPDLNNQMQILMTKNTFAVTAWLYQIPNQPLKFANDSRMRKEDAIIAYTWDMFIQTKDPVWLARFPMVKAASRALDVMQIFAKEKLDLDIQKFAVGGASKRGWTAWLTAAVEYKRVDTVIPLVIDVLNMQPVFVHIYNSICRWPESMKDYVEQGITKFIDQPEFLEIADQVDPLLFTDRMMDIDKMIINAGNDQFFWPDDSTYSYNKIPGTMKRIRYVPNAEHSLAGSDVPFATTSYLYARLYDIQLPEYTFDQQFTAEGANISVTVTKGKLPSQVNLWQITNEKARDFRIDTVGRTYTSTPLTSDTNTWSASVANPSSGYRAFFIELVYNNYFDGVTLPALKFTTSGYITPNTFPKCA